MATEQNSILFSAIFFTLSLNYKQMELYHAIPIFVYLLSAYCIEQGRIKYDGFFSFVCFFYYEFDLDGRLFSRWDW
jgi:hypothetical protein